APTSASRLPLALHDALPISTQHEAVRNRARAGGGPCQRSDAPVPAWARDRARAVEAMGVRLAIVFALTMAVTGCGGSARETERRSEEHTSELQSRVDLVCRL